MRRKEKKIIADSMILLCSGLLAFLLSEWQIKQLWRSPLLLVVILLIVGTAADLVIQCCKRKPEYKKAMLADMTGIQQLILLDEQDKPVKAWDVSGKTAVVIGKSGHDEEVDVDLMDCEYSSFIDMQHAALNYCLNSWYVEDLGSQNGVKIKKVEDGICYKVLNRPCKVSAGDVIYIANTRLLLT